MSSFTKTVTDKQLAANRANGALSHGPATPEGLARSSQNRRWHGMCGRFGVLACEDQQAFEALFDAFLADEQPVGSVEKELVRKMVEYTWMRQRASYMMNGCFEAAERTPDLQTPEQHNVAIDVKRLMLMVRYEAHFDRCYSKASNELLRRRKERESYGRIGSNRKDARKPKKSVASAGKSEAKKSTICMSCDTN
jgi:hypothetical protein